MYEELVARLWARAAEIAHECYFGPGIAAGLRNGETVECLASYARLAGHAGNAVLDLLEAADAIEFLSIFQPAPPAPITITTTGGTAKAAPVEFYYDNQTMPRVHP